MTPAAVERKQVRDPLLWISAVAWTLLVIAPRGKAVHAFCSLAMLGMDGSPGTLRSLLTVNSVALLAVGWVLMLAAMMAPTLIAPLRYVRDRSLARRRTRAIALFVAGYGAIWMAGGAVLLAIGFAVASLPARASWVPLTVVAAVALAWQFSPLKQQCLNLCHNHRELAAFGWAADRDALGFGLTHGVWCAGSCWALMLLPLPISKGHVAAMAAVTLWILSERLDTPMPSRWRWRGPAKIARIALAQTWVRLQRS